MKESHKRTLKAAATHMAAALAGAALERKVLAPRNARRRARAQEAADWEQLGVVVTKLQDFANAQAVLLTTAILFAREVAKAGRQSPFDLERFPNFDVENTDELVKLLNGQPNKLSWNPSGGQEADKLEGSIVELCCVTLRNLLDNPGSPPKIEGEGMSLIETWTTRLRTQAALDQAQRSYVLRVADEWQQQGRSSYYTGIIREVAKAA